MCSWFLIVLDHWNISPRVDMLPHSDTYKNVIQIPGQSVFALTPYWCVLCGEAANTNFIVCAINLIQPVLEPMIYNTWGEHANHYTTANTNFIVIGLTQLWI